MGQEPADSGIFNRYAFFLYGRRGCYQGRLRTRAQFVGPPPYRGTCRPKPPRTFFFLFFRNGIAYVHVAERYFSETATFVILAWWEVILNSTSPIFLILFFFLKNNKRVRSLDSVAWSVGSGDLSVSMQMMWVENRMVCNRKMRVAMRKEELDLVV